MGSGDTLVVSAVVVSVVVVSTGVVFSVVVVESVVVEAEEVLLVLETGSVDDATVLLSVVAVVSEVAGGGVVVVGLGGTGEEGVGKADDVGHLPGVEPRVPFASWTQ